MIELPAGVGIVDFEKTTYAEQNMSHEAAS
jgi:hypothetical protein